MASASSIVTKQEWWRDRFWSRVWQ